MGADGGSIPKRAELVKTRNRSGELVNDQRQAYLDNFRYCALSKELLRAPVVVCRLGRLYNKEAILRHLLAHKMQRKNPSSGREEDEPTALDRSVAHIRTSKDVKPLRLTENPAVKEEGGGGGAAGDYPRHFPFICPVTGKEMNGNFRFYFLKGCGCVFSEQALKEISTKTCPTCSKDREANDLEGINPDEGSRQGSGSAEGPSAHNRAASARSETLAEGKRPLAELNEPPADFPADGLEEDELELRGPLTSRPTVFKRSAAISALYKR